MDSFDVIQHNHCLMQQKRIIRQTKSQNNLFHISTNKRIGASSFKNKLYICQFIQYNNIHKQHFKMDIFVLLRQRLELYHPNQDQQVHPHSHQHSFQQPYYPHVHLSQDSCILLILLGAIQEEFLVDHS